MLKHEELSNLDGDNIPTEEGEYEFKAPSKGTKIEKTARNITNNKRLSLIQRCYNSRGADNCCHKMFSIPANDTTRAYVVTDKPFKFDYDKAAPENGTTACNAATCITTFKKHMRSFHKIEPEDITSPFFRTVNNSHHTVKTEKKHSANDNDSEEEE